MILPTHLRDMEWDLAKPLFTYYHREYISSALMGLPDWFYPNIQKEMELAHEEPLHIISQEDISSKLMSLPNLFCLHVWRGEPLHGHDITSWTHLTPFNKKGYINLIGHGISRVIITYHWPGNLICQAIWIYGPTRLNFILSRDMQLAPAEPLQTIIHTKI